ncbi:MAG: efflux RND transporter permease subunit [Deltaproteobacteria bacterium]|nr:efflux RND transporter permease subunit [Deltaproteobacteria bacterium]
MNPIARVIAFCADRPLPVLALTLIACGLALGTLSQAPLDAVPDVSDVQVVIATPWEGRSPDVVEDQVTYPLSTAFVATPGVRVVRAQSSFGLSLVTVIFEDGTDASWARARVLESLSSRTRLPADARPTLGPDASGVGWIYQYALVDESGRMGLHELRALQDWSLRFQLEAVEGVAEVASVGGFVREIQVLLDPARLRGLGITTADVVAAVRAATGDAGGHVLELAGHEHMIRARAQATTPAQIAHALVRTDDDGVPVRVEDVAEVAWGPAPRRSVADLDGEREVVGGIVIMRQQQNALTVLDAVKRRIDELGAGLPPGVRIVPTYDRSPLIIESVNTLRDTVLQEMLVVALVIFFFLRHVRSALVPVLSLPLAAIISFLPVTAQGLTINIMSLGGIAVAIGAMVDASIVLIENVHNRLELFDRNPDGRTRRVVVIEAMQEVGPSIFFSLLVMTVSFAPVFTLPGVEGRLFAPLAFTKTYALACAALLAITLTPALIGFFVRGKAHAEDEDVISRALQRVYAPVVRAVVRWPLVPIVIAVALMAVTVPLFLRLDEELMPPLDEGVILYMPTAPPGMSVATAADVLTRIDAELLRVPEVDHVFGKMGRAESATDPAPLGMAEITVTFKPKEQWRPGKRMSDLVAEMDQLLQVPGLPNIWWMPIQTRIEMLSTGVKSPVAAQLSGPNLPTLERAALLVERALKNVPGTRNVVAERQAGGFFVDVRVRRDDCARLGVRVDDVLEAVAVAVGGMPVAEIIDGRQRFGVSVRLPKESRDDPEEIAAVLVPTLRDTQIALGEVADVVTTSGADMVRSEDGLLVSYVLIDTDRPVAGWVKDAQPLVDALRLPEGVRLSWAGQIEHLEASRDRLAWVVPVTLALIALLLWWSTKSVVETGIVLLAVPFSLIGAVWLLWALDYHLSVAVWVGLIALAGLDAETGVVMLLYLTIAHREHHALGMLRTRADLTNAIVEGAARRIRPKLMTVVTELSLLPLLWSDGTGADVMKRVAAPMIGGIASSFVLELLLYPALFALWKGRGLPAGSAVGAAAENS